MLIRHSEVVVQKSSDKVFKLKQCIILAIIMMWIIKGYISIYLYGSPSFHVTGEVSSDHIAWRWLVYKANIGLYQMGWMLYCSHHCNNTVRRGLWMTVCFQLGCVFQKSCQLTIIVTFLLGLIYGHNVLSHPQWWKQGCFMTLWGISDLNNLKYKVAPWPDVSIISGIINKKAVLDTLFHGSSTFLNLWGPLNFEKGWWAPSQNGYWSKWS